MRSGLTAGLPDQQTFGADEIITGAEAGVMLKNALALTADAPEEAAKTSAEESETSAWAQTALAAAVRNGFNLEADAPLTRETAAEILYRAWQMENELIAKA